MLQLVTFSSINLSTKFEKQVYKYRPRVICLLSICFGGLVSRHNLCPSVSVGPSTAPQRAELSHNCVGVISFMIRTLGEKMALWSTKELLNFPAEFSWTFQLSTAGSFFSAVCLCLFKTIKQISDKLLITPIPSPAFAPAAPIPGLRSVESKSIDFFHFADSSKNKLGHCDNTLILNKQTELVMCKS